MVGVANAVFREGSDQNCTIQERVPCTACVPSLYLPKGGHRLAEASQIDVQRFLPGFIGHQISVSANSAAV